MDTGESFQADGWFVGCHGDRGAGDGAELGERAVANRTPFPDDRDPIAELLDLREDVARQQHRGAAFDRVDDRLLEGRFHQWIETRRRFVEDEQFDVGCERGDQRDLLAVPLRVRAALLARVELEPIDEFVAASTVDPTPQPEQEVDDLTTREARPEAHVARDVGEASVQCDRVGPRVAAEHGHRAAVGSEQAEQDPDRHRLARAVRPEKAVDLAAIDLQVEPVQRARRAEGLDETRDRDDRLARPCRSRNPVRVVSWSSLDTLRRSLPPNQVVRRCSRAVRPPCRVERLWSGRAAAGGSWRHGR